MATINLEWITDYTDCETCGGSYAEGAVVTIDEHVIDMAPFATCCSPVNYSNSQVYNAILEHLGHKVVVTSTVNNEDIADD
jgi:hypothetical protein